MEDRTDKEKNKERRIKKEIAKLKRNWIKKGEKPDDLTKKLMEFCMRLFRTSPS